MLAFPLISYTSIPIEARLSDVFVTATGTLVAMLAIATDAKFLFGNKIGNEIDAYPDESVSLFPHCLLSNGNIQACRICQSRRPYIASSCRVVIIR